MKKIYWAIQNLDSFGGSEMVSTNLCNLLASDYDITLIVTTRQDEATLYELDPRIKIVNLGIDPRISRLNNYATKLKEKHKYFSLILNSKNL